MLPPPTQRHLYGQIPREYTIEYAKQTPGSATPVSATVDITVRDHQQREPPRELYPLVAAWFDPIAVSWNPGERLPDTHHKEDRPDDPLVAYDEHVGEDVYDQLNLIVAVADGIDATGDGSTDIPQRVVANELASEVYASFLLGTDYLNDEQYMSGDYEWPVKVVETPGPGITQMPGLRDDQDIQRYAMQFNCRYTMTESREVPATAAIGYTADVSRGDEEVAGVVDLIPEYGADYYGVGEYGE